MEHCRAVPLALVMVLAVATPPSLANGVRGGSPPPPPPSRIPCCYLENQLAYDEALYAAWSCTLALESEPASGRKKSRKKRSGGGAQGRIGGMHGSSSLPDRETFPGVTPDRGCWLGAFDSRCAASLYDSYAGISRVTGQYYLLDRLKKEIEFLREKMKNCDTSPYPSHPLLQYCKSYCEAPDLYGHGTPSSASKTGSSEKEHGNSQSSPPPRGRSLQK